MLHVKIIRSFQGSRPGERTSGRDEGEVQRKGRGRGIEGGRRERGTEEGRVTEEEVRERVDRRRVRVEEGTDRGLDGQRGEKEGVVEEEVRENFFFSFQGSRLNKIEQHLPICSYLTNFDKYKPMILSCEKRHVVSDKLISIEFLVV